MKNRFYLFRRYNGTTVRTAIYNGKFIVCCKDLALQYSVAVASVLPLFNKLGVDVVILGHRDIATANNTPKEYDTKTRLGFTDMNGVCAFAERYGDGVEDRVVKWLQKTAEEAIVREKVSGTWDGMGALLTDSEVVADAVEVVYEKEKDKINDNEIVIDSDLSIDNTDHQLIVPGSENSRSDILNIDNVRCYEKDGTIYLNLEDVARGLGFTNIANSGNVVVRWARLEKYLNKLSVTTCGHDDFIPENIFYRLAMKANNKVAEEFQAKVADEIIPSIRKHGAYMTGDTIKKALASPDFLIQLATNLKNEAEGRKVAEAKNKLLSIENDTLARRINYWEPRTILTELVKQYSYKACSGRIADKVKTGWKKFYYDLERKYHISCVMRKSHDAEATDRTPLIEYIRDDEFAACIALMVAECKAIGMDVSETLSHYAEADRLAC